ncbi:hypothetical protein [Acutalibacter muris]|jgi:hypothetical protein|uniref:hypothetical protein n=1 Tax=Acutalibacter muris TaxID=1796620 RepID=UPI00272EC849|nr:hypothetical protein [Acutalibacter muris]
MKVKFFKFMSFALVLSLVVCTYILPASAQTTISKSTMVTGMLTDPGDTATYDLQIDHALYPEAVLYVFSHHGTGNATITVYNEAGSPVSATSIRPRLNDNRTEYILAPRGACYIRSSERITKNYRVTVEATTEDVGYAINIGTIDD